MSQISRSSSGVSLLIAVTALFSVARYAHMLFKTVLESSFLDFAHYYTYATVVRLGLDPFGAVSVAHVDDLLGIRRAGAAANYPPAFYLLMQPWVALPVEWAAVGWLALGQLCLLTSLAFFLRAFPATPLPAAAAALFVVLNYQPLVETLVLGQANLVLLFLLTFAWWGLRTGRPWLAAIGIALAVHVKVQYGLLVVLLFWIGQYAAGVRTVGLVAAILGLSMALLGRAHYAAYISYLFSPPEYLHTWTANLAPWAVLHRLLPSAQVARILALGLDATLLVILSRRLPRGAGAASACVDRAWAVGLAAVPLLSPLTEEHHLVVLLLPITVLLLDMPEHRTDQAVLIGGILLLGSRYSLERFPGLQQGVWSLLTTGKLLGLGALLWALLRRPDGGKGVQAPRSP